MTACCPVAGVTLLGNESSGCLSEGDIKEEIDIHLPDRLKLITGSLLGINKTHIKWNFTQCTDIIHVW